MNDLEDKHFLKDRSDIATSKQKKKQWIIKNCSLVADVVICLKLRERYVIRHVESELVLIQFRTAQFLES